MTTDTQPDSNPTSNEVRARALKLLARREHAPVELAFKLDQRGYPDALVQEVLAELIEDNLLSSSRYAEALTRSRIEKGNGPLRIRDELTGNAIDESIIEDALDAAEVDWNDLARRVRHKRFGAQHPRDFPAKAKQMRFLQQRGFANSHIKAAFDS